MPASKEETPHRQRRMNFKLVRLLAIAAGVAVVLTDGHATASDNTPPSAVSWPAHSAISKTTGPIPFRNTRWKQCAELRITNPAGMVGGSWQADLSLEGGGSALPDIVSLQGASFARVVKDKDTADNLKAVFRLSPMEDLPTELAAGDSHVVPFCVSYVESWKAHASVSITPPPSTDSSDLFVQVQTDGTSGKTSRMLMKRQSNYQFVSDFATGQCRCLPVNNGGQRLNAGAAMDSNVVATTKTTTSTTTTTTKSVVPTTTVAPVPPPPPPPAPVPVAVSTSTASKTATITTLTTTTASQTKSSTTLSRTTTNAAAAPTTTTTAASADSIRLLLRSGRIDCPTYLLGSGTSSSPQIPFLSSTTCDSPLANLFFANGTAMTPGNNWQACNSQDQFQILNSNYNWVNAPDNSLYTVPAGTSNPQLDMNFYATRQSVDVLQRRNCNTELQGSTSAPSWYTASLQGKLLRLRVNCNNNQNVGYVYFVVGRFKKKSRRFRENRPTR